jgi:hypothetical protein
VEDNLKDLLVEKNETEITPLINLKSNFWGVDFDEINGGNHSGVSIQEVNKKNEDNIIPSNMNEKQDINQFLNEARVNLKTDEVLEDRLENIRLKYIVGKIVGEDLVDNKGTVIAIKDSLITAELIDIALMHGKLSELILNMMFEE